MGSHTSSNPISLVSSQRSIYLSCFYGFFVNGGISLIIGAILPYMKASYELDYVILGTLISIYSVGMLVSSFISGFLPMYIGARKSIMLLSSTGVMGFVLITVISNSYLLAFAFFLIGVNRGAVSHFSMSIINEIATGKGSTSNVLHSLYAVGAFISPFTAMVFANINKNGWKYAALFWALLCFIEIFVYRFMKIPSNGEVCKEGYRKKIDLGFLKNKFFITACGILFFYLCTEQAVNGWLVTYFIESEILNTNLAQTMSSLLWLVILFGRLITAYFSTKIKKSKLLLIKASGSVIFFSLLILGRAIIPVAIGIIGTGFCLSGLYPTTVASIGKILKEYPMGFSFLQAISGFGSILMPSIVGVAADNIGIVGGMSTVTFAVAITLFFIIYNAYIYKGEQN